MAPFQLDQVRTVSVPSSAKVHWHSYRWPGNSTHFPTSRGSIRGRKVQPTAMSTRMIHPRPAGDGDDWTSAAPVGHSHVT